MRPVTVTVGPLAAASATNIRTATTGSAGTLVLNGTLTSASNQFYVIPQGNGSKVIVAPGQALLDSPRQILFTTAGADGGKTVVITGLDRQGNPQTETVTLVGTGTVASVLSYSVILTMVLSANTVAALSIGTNGIAESMWVRMDDWAPGLAFLEVIVNGTVNYTVQQTGDDPNSPTNPVAPASVTWQNSTDANVVAQAASKQSSYSVSPTMVKLVLNSQTNPGFATMTITQLGVNPT